MEKRCDNCTHFLPGDIERGLCRRYPPQMTMATVKVRKEGGETEFESNWQFLPMMNFGRCGEYRATGRAKNG